MDVEGVVTRLGIGLDTALVLRELEPVLDLKDDTTSLARLRSILDRDPPASHASC